MEDQAPHRRLEACPLCREMDLVYRVVQIGQAVAHEHIGWQGVEDAPGRVEGGGCVRILRACIPLLTG